MMLLLRILKENNINYESDVIFLKDNAIIHASKITKH
jgi:hypothetical protein